MNVEQFKQVLPIILESGATPWIWGYHGKGKTEVPTKIYTDLGWYFYNCRLNTKSDVSDISGLVDFLTDHNNNKVASRNCIPEWLLAGINFALENPNKGSVIYLDEINRPASPELLGPIFQMVLDKRLDSTVFPPNLYFIASGNPPTSDYGVLKVKEKALLSRFWHVYFDPPKSEWFKYAEENNYDPMLINFYKDHPEALEMDDLKTFSISEFATPDRRKAKFIDKILKHNLPEELLFETLAGFVGFEMARLFVVYKEKEEKPLTKDDILLNYGVNRNRVVKAIKENRTDILHKAKEEVANFFSKGETFDKLMGENAIRFANDLPNDLMFDLMHSIYNKRTFHEFCEENYSLLSGIEKRLIEVRKVVKPETVQDIINNI